MTFLTFKSANMKKCYVPLIMFLLFAELLPAQTGYELKQAMDHFKTNKLSEEDSRGILNSNNIEGSPYLEDDFINGSVYTTSSTEYKDIPLRYNIYNDQLEFKTDDNTVQALATPEILESVEFGKYKLVYAPYLAAKKIKRGFFVVLVDGNTSLYSKPRIRFKEPSKPSGYKEAEPAKFIKSPNEYYIRIGTSQAQLVSNKKDLYKIFHDHQKQIETFIKKHKIKANKPEALQKLIQYYNTL